MHEEAALQSRALHLIGTATRVQIMKLLWGHSRLNPAHCQKLSWKIELSGLRAPPHMCTSSDRCSSLYWKYHIGRGPPLQVASVSTKGDFSVQVFRECLACCTVLPCHSVSTQRSRCSYQMRLHTTPS